MNNINTALHGKKLNTSSVTYAVSALVLAMSFLISNQVLAAELEPAQANSNGRSSYSMDSKTSDKAKINVQSLLEQNVLTAKSLVTKGERQANPSITSNNGSDSVYFNNTITTNSLSHSFSIADANVFLINDDDFDGFYHHFSVNFDADVSSGSADVYARMYISYEGGPWNHYYTTRTFRIFGNDSFDDHTVETIFSIGYIPGYYDIRIDLFEAGWTDRVAVYGPYENYELSSVPLEDEGYDFYEGDVVAGCSLNSNADFDPMLPILFLMSLLYFIRKHKSKNILRRN